MSQSAYERSLAMRGIDVSADEKRRSAMYELEMSNPEREFERQQQALGLPISVNVSASPAGYAYAQTPVVIEAGLQQGPPPHECGECGECRQCEKDACGKPCMCCGDQVTCSIVLPCGYKAFNYIFLFVSIVTLCIDSATFNAAPNPGAGGFWHAMFCIIAAACGGFFSCNKLLTLHTFFWAVCTTITGIIALIIDSPQRVGVRDIFECCSRRSDSCATNPNPKAPPGIPSLLYACMQYDDAFYQSDQQPDMACIAKAGSRSFNTPQPMLTNTTIDPTCAMGFSLSNRMPSPMLNGPFVVFLYNTHKTPDFMLHRYLKLVSASIAFDAITFAMAFILLFYTLSALIMSASCCSRSSPPIATASGGGGTYSHTYPSQRPTAHQIVDHHTPSYATSAGGSAPAYAYGGDYSNRKDAGGTYATAAALPYPVAPSSSASSINNQKQTNQSELYA